MGPPTPIWFIAGLLSSAYGPPTFTTMTSARSGRWRFPINLTRALRDPERRQGRPGDLSQPSSPTPVGGGNPSGEEILPGSFAVPSCRVLRQGGFFPSVAIRFGWTHHATSQPSPPILVACIAPQGAFQGQLFHPRGASPRRYGPTAHRLPVRAMEISSHCINALRGAPAPASHCTDTPPCDGG